MAAHMDLEKAQSFLHLVRRWRARFSQPHDWPIHCRLPSIRDSRASSPTFVPTSKLSRRNHSLIIETPVTANPNSASPAFTQTFAAVEDQ